MVVEKVEGLCKVPTGRIRARTLSVIECRRIFRRYVQCRIRLAGGSVRIMLWLADVYFLFLCPFQTGAQQCVLHWTPVQIHSCTPHLLVSDLLDTDYRLPPSEARKPKTFPIVPVVD